MERRKIIGVMGGDHSVGAAASDAKRVGASVTRAQSILLTGGRSIDNTKVKDVAMKGAKDEQSRTGNIARLIGIIPDGRRDWDEGQDHCLFVTTNLSHMERDAINGVTPDVLIFFAGSSGTLCELAFALQAKRPVLFWRAAQILRHKYQEHTADGEVDEFLETALSASRTKLGSVSGVQKETTVSSLRGALFSGLVQAEDFSGGIDDLVAESIRLVGRPPVASGFPGFRDELNSKERFERIVERISS